MTRILTNVSESVSAPTGQRGPSSRHAGSSQHPASSSRGPSPGRGPSPRPSARLVPFVFGVTGRRELPGTVLVRLLEDLGLTAGAARAVIARLRAEGNLAGTARGRGVDYRVDGILVRGFERVRTGGPGVEWSGAFHALIYHVPEADRAFRDQLRRVAFLSGFGLLSHGILISLFDRFGELDALLAGAPADARIYRCRLAMSEAEASRAAREAWDLDELGSAMRAHLEVLQAAVSPSTGPERVDGEALRYFAELTGPALGALLRAPSLPAVLRPPGWPVDELRAAIEAVELRHFPPVRRYVERLLDPADPVDPER